MKFDIIVPHKKSKIDGGINVVKLITNKLNEVVYFTRLACPYGFRKKIRFFIIMLIQYLLNQSSSQIFKLENR